MEHSAGHIAFVNDHEYYELAGQVYMAHVSCVFDLRTGARIGRWESSRSHWDQYNTLARLQSIYGN